MSHLGNCLLSSNLISAPQAAVHTLNAAHWVFWCFRCGQLSLDFPALPLSHSADPTVALPRHIRHTVKTHLFAAAAGALQVALRARARSHSSRKR